MTTKAPVIKKKVRPYPFEATLEAGALKLVVHVRKLTLKGLIIDLGKGIVQIGAQYSIRFVLPTMDLEVAAAVKVMKTYDQLRELAEKSTAVKVERLAECHFLNLGEDQKAKISRFMTAIRQT